MIYTVTLNPAVDCTVSVSALNVGEINRAERQVLMAGGKGINMSVILHGLGIPTKALGFTGGETGRLLCGLLDKSGCPYAMTDLEGQQTRVNVKLRNGDIETEINGRGPDISPGEIRAFMKMLDDTLSEKDTLILAGSIPASVSDTVYADIMDMLSDRDIRIAADTSGKALSALLPYRPFLIKPNGHELGEIIGVSVETHEEAFRGAEELQRMGARNIIVSLAGEGAVFLSEDGSRSECGAPKGRVVNSVGAGDSMLAGFLAGLEMFGDTERALALGTAAGSSTAFSEGLADAGQILAMYERLTAVMKND